MRNHSRSHKHRTAFAASGALLIACLGATASAADEPRADRRRELLQLLRHDCGSCHGLTLRGGLGPALLPENVAGKPTLWLRDQVLNGRPGSAMPPWRPFLSADEALWLVEQLQQGVNDGR